MRTKKAAAGTAAKQKKRHSKAYIKNPPMSSNNSKSDIGELLWSLQFSVGFELQQIGWGLVERLLRRHIGLVVPPKCPSEPLQSTFSRRPE